MTLLNELINVDIGDGSATIHTPNPEEICAKFFINANAAAEFFSICRAKFKRILIELNCPKWPARMVNARVKQLIRSPGFQLDNIDKLQLESAVNDISNKVDKHEKVFTKALIRNALIDSWLPAIVKKLSDKNQQLLLKEKTTPNVDVRFFSPITSSYKVLGKRPQTSSTEEPASKRRVSNYQFEFGRCPNTGIPQIQDWKRENSLI